jgi:hypothetical protein
MEPIEAQKAKRACEILAELDLDCWLIWVREMDQIAGSAMRLVLDGDAVGRTAMLRTREGERIAIVANYDADGLPERSFDRVIPYEEGLIQRL